MVHERCRRAKFDAADLTQIHEGDAFVRHRLAAVFEPLAYLLEDRLAYAVACEHAIGAAGAVFVTA